MLFVCVTVRLQEGRTPVWQSDIKDPTGVSAHAAAILQAEQRGSAPLRRVPQDIVDSVDKALKELELDSAQEVPIKKEGTKTAQERVETGSVTKADGGSVSDLSVNLSLFYLYERQRDPSNDLRTKLGKCAALFQRATKAPALALNAKRKEWERWEEFVSRLACLAFHMYMVQSCYGVLQPGEVSGFLERLGMTDARNFLVKHLHCCRQPERFFEGLAVLELSGTPTDDLFKQWTTLMSDNRSLIWPETLKPLFGAKPSNSDTSSKDARRDAAHMYYVLLLYGATRHGCSPLERTNDHEQWEELVEDEKTKRGRAGCSSCSSGGCCFRCCEGQF